MIKRCTSVEQSGWPELRQALWPDGTPEQHLSEMSSFCANLERYAQFVAYSESNAPVGFVEAAIRTDYVNGVAPPDVPPKKTDRIIALRFFLVPAFFGSVKSNLARKWKLIQMSRCLDRTELSPIPDALAFHEPSGARAFVS